MLKAFKLSLLALGCLGFFAPAQAMGILTGLNAELAPYRNPQAPVPETGIKPQPILIGGAYLGTKGLELRPSVLWAQGKYQGFLLDGGLRITPVWLGQPEFLFDFVSPYVVLGGSYGVPNSFGWNAKAGLGFILMEAFALNAEIGYRSHKMSDTLLIEGSTITFRASIPF